MQEMKALARVTTHILVTAYRNGLEAQKNTWDEYSYADVTSGTLS